MKRIGRLVVLVAVTVASGIWASKALASPLSPDHSHSEMRDVDYTIVRTREVNAKVASPADASRRQARASGKEPDQKVASSAEATTLLSSSVDAKATALPSITIIVPTISLRFVAPASPVFLANAAPCSGDPEFSIARVEFLDNGSVIGSVALPNSASTGYAFTWTNAPIGLHSISARVLDVSGRSATSGATSVNVLPGARNPEVRLTSPGSGGVFTSADTISASAVVVAGSRPVKRVEFLAGSTVFATALAPPYTGTWFNPPPGNFMIVARVFDESGGNSSSAASYIQVLGSARPIALVLTSPAPGASLAAGSTVSLSASAIAPDGVVANVDFLANGQLIGSTTAPSGSDPTIYQFQWPNVRPGSYALVAKATALVGASNTSSVVNISISDDPSPLVSLTAPVADARYALGDAITLTASATASVPLGRIEFYGDGKQLGSVSAAAGSKALTANYSWVGAAAGVHAIVAKGFTANGASGASPAVSVTVASAPTSIAIISPLSGAAFGGGQSIAVVSHMTTSSGGVSRVDYYSDAVLLGSLPVNAAPMVMDATFTITGLPAGAHQITARVVSVDGTNATSSPVAVTVSSLSVTLSSPMTGQVEQASDDIRMIANPVLGAAAIARVDFIVDGRLLVTTNAAPYSSYWHGAPVGTHVLVAQVTDTSGIVAVSSPVNVTVIDQPSLTLGAGIEGSTVNDNVASISGTVQAGANSVVSVNGVLALVDRQGNFFASAVPLVAGSNAVNLTLNTLGANPVVRTFNLQSAGVAPFTLALGASQGIAPLATTLTIADPGNVAFQRIEVAYDDSDTADQVITALLNGEATLSITYGTVGIHTIRVTVYDRDNKIIYLGRRRVQVLDPGDIANIALNTYRTMLNQLKGGNMERALQYVTVGSRAKYRDVFTRLGTALGVTAGGVGLVRSVTVTEDYADIVVTRDKADGTYAYHTRLIQDGDGVWRVDGM